MQCGHAAWRQSRRNPRGVAVVASQPTRHGGGRVATHTAWWWLHRNLCGMVVVMLQPMRCGGGRIAVVRSDSRRNVAVQRNGGHIS